MQRTSKAWVHWSQTLLCMVSDPTLNKGNEKPTGAAYPISYGATLQFQSSWSQLFLGTGNWMGGKFTYALFTWLIGVCIRPGEKFSTPYTAHLQNWCSRGDLVRVKLSSFPPPALMPYFPSVINRDGCLLLRGLFNCGDSSRAVPWGCLHK